MLVLYFDVINYMIGLCITSATFVLLFLYRFAHRRGYMFGFENGFNRAAELTFIVMRDQVAAGWYFDPKQNCWINGKRKMKNEEFAKLIFGGQ